MLFATDAAAEDEDPVISPDGCAWIAGGLERFVAGHQDYGDEVTFDSVSTVLRRALEGSRLADQQLRWLESRLDGAARRVRRRTAVELLADELDVLAAVLPAVRRPRLRRLRRLLADASRPRSSSGLAATERGRPEIRTGAFIIFGCVFVHVTTGQ